MVYKNSLSNNLKIPETFAAFSLFLGVGVWARFLSRSAYSGGRGYVAPVFIPLFQRNRGDHKFIEPNVSSVPCSPYVKLDWVKYLMLRPTASSQGVASCGCGCCWLPYAETDAETRDS